MSTACIRLSSEDLHDTWEQYKQSGCEAARNRLVEHYGPIVKRLAPRLHEKLPEAVELDDLISVGFLGLVDALRTYDPDRGVRFETYAAWRIQGAMLDELRHLDWVPRLVRSRATRMAQATQKLISQFGREPSREELARELRVPVRKLSEFQDKAAPREVVSLEHTFAGTETDRELRSIDVLEDASVEPPHLPAVRKDLREYVVKGLSHTERLTILLYYYEGMTFKEIGQALNLSESRISQIHTQTIERLRETLENRPGDAPSRQRVG